MEKNKKPNSGLSYTLKGVMIAGLSLFLLIPSCLVQNLVNERKQTRDEAVVKIDNKWSLPQTISGPVLSLPFTKLVDGDKDGKYSRSETLNITPEKLVINCKLFPEERYYSIYKTIVYKSIVTMEGEFAAVDTALLPVDAISVGRPYVKIGMSDRRGITGDPVFEMSGRSFELATGSNPDNLMGELLVVDLKDMQLDERMLFSISFELKGSSSVNFLPVGQTSIVNVEGQWPDPGFIGNYTPDYTFSDGGFEAKWEVSRFNRNMPDVWYDGDNIYSERDISFGVNLVDMVDVYQQSLRSTKYALMFIVLTFVIFFFVEIFTHKKIHPIQYVLVGVALVLFYSLLISLAEMLGFGFAYLISSVATIGLITAFAGAIFKDRKPTITLAVILSALYAFLYVILQLEEAALLAGSIGLFVILGVIMYVSNKIKWYNEPGADTE